MLKKAGLFIFIVLVSGPLLLFEANGEEPINEPKV
jgi:hypothetical protein